MSAKGLITFLLAAVYVVVLLFYVPYSPKQYVPETMSVPPQLALMWWLGLGVVVLTAVYGWLCLAEYNRKEGKR